LLKLERLNHTEVTVDSAVPTSNKTHIIDITSLTGQRSVHK